MYKLDITYSWDDAEEGMQFTSFQKAWEKAKELAMKEVETISIEHGAESGLFIDSDMVQEKGTITLHYLYDDTYCYYRVGHVHDKDAVSTSVEYDSFEDIGKHAMRYALHTDVCAYYSDMEDFFSDWCSIGYSRTEARKLMHGGHGEFMKLPDELGYIRFVI